MTRIDELESELTENPADTEAQQELLDEILSEEVEELENK